MKDQVTIKKGMIRESSAMVFQWIDTGNHSVPINVISY